MTRGNYNIPKEILFYGACEHMKKVNKVTLMLLNRVPLTNIPKPLPSPPSFPKVTLLSESPTSFKPVKCDYLTSLENPYLFPQSLVYLIPIPPTQLLVRQYRVSYLPSQLKGEDIELPQCVKGHSAVRGRSRLVPLSSKPAFSLNHNASVVRPLLQGQAYP